MRVAGADRQLRVFDATDGDLKAVVDHLNRRDEDRAGHLASTQGIGVRKRKTEKAGIGSACSAHDSRLAFRLNACADA